MSNNNDDLIRDPFDPASGLDESELDAHIIELSELASLIVVTADAGCWDWIESAPLITAMDDPRLLQQWRDFCRGRAFPLPRDAFECALRLAGRIAIREG